MRISTTATSCAATKDCEPLASKSTLNRFELCAAGANADRRRKITADFGQLDELLVQLFLELWEEPARELVLDLDATDIPLYG